MLTFDSVDSTVVFKLFENFSCTSILFYSKINYNCKELAQNKKKKNNNNNIMIKIYIHMY